MNDDNFSVYVRCSADGLSDSSREVADGVNVDSGDDGVSGVEVLNAHEVFIDGRPVVEYRDDIRVLPTPEGNVYDQTTHPREDEVGTLRIANDDHLFIKLAQPADEPWHIVYAVGKQRLSGWQSDDCMIGTIKIDRTPVELAFPESPKAEVDAVAKALHGHGKERGLCHDDWHNWAIHRSPARSALLAAPRRHAISQAQIDVVVNEFSHACPYCPSDRTAWVVGVNEMPEIIQRIIGAPVVGTEAEVRCPECGTTIRSRLGDQVVIDELLAQGWRPPWETENK